MDNIDVLVLKALRDWRSAGQHALLATVVRTWGSSPRPVGSMMALREDGRAIGSVSGGCIEDDLKCLKDMRTKAYRAFVVEGRIDEIVALRRQALHRLGYSLSFDAGSADEMCLFREAAVFLGRLEDGSIWLPWSKAARDRCALLRGWGEAGGQHRWLVAERMRQGGHGAEPAT